MRVAIVGSGVSGLAALWVRHILPSGLRRDADEELLNEYSEHEVNIYEKNDYPGGHTHTVEFERPGKEKCMVDTGFIVLNPPTYPNFLRFLRLLKIPLLATEMTFSISRDRGSFEWAGGGGAYRVFSQLSNVLNPRVWRMVFDVFRFNLFAPDLLHNTGKLGEMSIGDYLEREGYGDGFKDDYLIPMTAAIWSTPADRAALDFPASTLIRFFHNHHLLQLSGKPKWLTVKGGSKRYVDAILSKLPSENLHLNTEITEVSSVDGGVELVEVGGRRHIYDHVILATHSDTTLKMLRKGGGVQPMEEKVLGPWQWSSNHAILHWDTNLMPVRRIAYSAWNYLTSTSTSSPSASGSSKSKSNGHSHMNGKSPSPSGSSVDVVSLTYSMNILQHLSESRHGPVLVTLNPPFPPNPSKVIGEWTYEHPMMTSSSVASQSHLPEIQNTRGISYVGAWTKYGFHEDGFASAMRLVSAAPFNVKGPWEVIPATRDLPTLGPVDRSGRAVILGLLAVGKQMEWMWVLIAATMAQVLVWLEWTLAQAGLRGLRKELGGVRECWEYSAGIDRKSR